ncbi:MAG: hypothetical protein PT944_02665 [Actinomycetaceae bacterium]|nr:hypothetical protein [Arcanobacterium sp.]MDD7686807.1 hypothetical protein [Actinomycetaceae bacterium]MDY5273610.1 hypothetical protein [Arcanobacterium sp.]
MLNTNNDHTAYCLLILAKLALAKQTAGGNADGGALETTCYFAAPRRE